MTAPERGTPRSRTVTRRGLRQRVVGAITISALLAACGATGSAASTSSSTANSTATSSAASGSTAGTTGTATTATAGALFDSSVVHTISVSYDEAAYQTMIDTFVATGEKDWIAATVTIDGTEFTNVGIKLKGNSTLKGLSTAGNQGANGGGPGGDVSADDPAGLPWRIQLDKYADGQNYQGETDLVIRGGNTETSLNEAVALELIGAAGLATQQATSIRFSVNGSDQTLRLMIENPGDSWDAENFATDGILYKAEASGDYSYRGDDPTAYADAFDIDASSNGEDDYTPLIGFLDWLNSADDATFAAELSQHLDVAAFAKYLAMQELVANFDDIDGPGNNSYLRYDTSTGIFTVVSWDQNLSFGSMGGQMGGGMGGTGGQPGGGMNGGMRGGGNPAAPNAAGPNAAVPNAVAPNGAGGGPSRGNILSERFMANTDFAAQYTAALAELRAELYTSGAAQQILDSWTAVLTSQAGDLVSADTVASEAASIASYFTKT